ncbi:MAG: hypothetical protein ACREOZ_03705, partial [Gloeomargaritales cyanobacterium]
VGLPGTYNTFDDARDIGPLANVLEKIVNGVARKKGGQMDYQWRAEKRTAVATIKNLEELRVRRTEVYEAQHEIADLVLTNVMSILRSERWSSVEARRVASASSYVRLSTDSVEYYCRLHGHLYEVALDYGFAAAKLEIDFHARKLASIRMRAPSRLQAMCRLYIYLRAQAADHWLSLALQAKKEKDILGKTGTRQGHGKAQGEGGNENYSGRCSWCDHIIHSGGKPQCPWKSLSRAQAKVKAAKALARVVEGLEHREEEGEPKVKVCALQAQG